MTRFIEVPLASGTTRMLNADYIAEISQRDTDKTAIFQMADSTVHPTKMPYAEAKRLINSSAGSPSVR